MSELFEETEPKQPSSEYTKQCKRCQQELPLDEFYWNGKNFYTRCKTCLSQQRRLKSYVSVGLNTPYDQWPENIIALVSTAKSYQEHGGELAKEETSLVEFVRAATGETQCDDIELEVVPATLRPILIMMNEKINTLDAEIQQLHKSIDLLVSKDRDLIAVKQRRGYPQELQEQLNLITSISKDQQLRDTMGDELDDLCGYFKEALLHIKQDVVIKPTDIRNIVATIESFQIALTDDMRIIYNRWIKPAIEYTRETEDYEKYANEVVDMTGQNFYWLDWEGLPYNV